MSTSSRVWTQPDRRLRITVVDDDETMLALFRDVLTEQGSISGVSTMTSMTAVAESRPDVVILGTGAGGQVSTWALLELIRQHRSLHAVPVIVCTLDVGADMRAGRLSAHPRVHALELPFAVELVRRLVSDAASAGAVAMAAPVSADVDTVRSMGRLPDVCAHGFVSDWVETCSLCLGDSVPGYSAARA